MENNDITQELLSAIYIQNVRLYDLLLVIGDKLGADVMSVKELHADGDTFSPPPYLKATDDEETV